MSDKPATACPTSPATRWKRWEMSAFDKKPEHRQPERTPSRRAEDIAAQIKQAQDAVREQARSQGYDAGHAQGLQAGLDEGRHAGRQEGYKAGRDAGYSDGHAQGIQQAAQETERLSALSTACARAIEGIEADVGQALVSLAIRIAEHALHSTLEAHPEKITDMVRQVLRINGQNSQTALSLRLNPSDLALVRQYLDTEPDAGNWRLCADEAIEPGGCIAETALGSIDATLQTRWRRTLAALGHDAQANDEGREP